MPLFFFQVKNENRASSRLSVGQSSIKIQVIAKSKNPCHFLKVNSGYTTVHGFIFSDLSMLQYLVSESFNKHETKLFQYLLLHLKDLWSLNKINTEQLIE